MKVLVFTLCFIALCSGQYFYTSTFLGNLKSDDPKADLGQIFDGFWEYANLTDPTQAIECFDEATANLSMIFIGTMLKEVAQELVVQIPKTISTFEKNFPKSVAECLAKDPEVAQLAQAYNITDTPFTVLESQISKYILLHIKTLNSQASSGYFYFIQGMYKDLGDLFGVVFRAMVAKSASVDTYSDVAPKSNDSLTNLQDLYNGLFEQANLSDPTELIQCYNETSAQVALDFFGDVIGDLASDNYLALIREYQVYKGGLSQDLLACIKNSSEFESAFDAYGFNSVTGKQLLQKYVTFNVQHHFVMLNGTKTIDQAVTSGDYESAGQITGELIQNIMGTDGTLADKKVIHMLWELIKQQMKDLFTN